ncbi:hypothetical protein E2C01_077173 [Portunus trituberculatus]|uniref:Uncharacterized protein n=1 Tax=Portunus trituberculatus TaxID=210409 RepID=A0A5B7IF52_PORTR|nr:hypothetical protein [Portunus trituberculatus]
MTLRDLTLISCLAAGHPLSSSVVEDFRSIHLASQAHCHSELTRTIRTLTYRCGSRRRKGKAEGGGQTWEKMGGKGGKGSAPTVCLRRWPAGWQNPLLHIDAWEVRGVGRGGGGCFALIQSRRPVRSVSSSAPAHQNMRNTLTRVMGTRHLYRSHGRICHD